MSQLCGIPLLKHVVWVGVEFPGLNGLLTTEGDKGKTLGQDFTMISMAFFLGTMDFLNMLSPIFLKYVQGIMIIMIKLYKTMIFRFVLLYTTNASRDTSSG